MSAKKLTVPEIVCVVVLAVVVIGVITANQPRPQEKGCITKAISNCRQVLTSMKIYAGDHDGKYPNVDVPNATTSNEVFKLLFVSNAIDNEMIFGSPSSDFRPDGNFGTAPDFTECLKPGENHWAMTQGLSSESAEGIPFVFENPASASWPPAWNAGRAWKPGKGRTWTKGRIIVGLNDGSVTLRDLAAQKGNAVGLAKERDGKDLFEAAIDAKEFPKGEVLDVE